MMDGPLVTVLIPMVDEEIDIRACLAAVLAQDYPAGRLEVVVVDGGSEDRSVATAERILTGARLAGWQVLHNSHRTTPSSLNVGLSKSTGKVVCRVDARTRVQPHHVRLCADRLQTDPAVAVVGGAQVAVPRGPGSRHQGIARALNNRLSMGGAAYRSRGRAGPTDTVYLGSFRTEELRRVGGWDERLPTNQDFDLNRRMGRLGLIWFDPEIRSGYVPRADLGALWRQYVRFGRWKVRYWRTTVDRPQRRQWLAIAAPSLPVVAAVALAVCRPSGLVPLAGVGAAGLVVLDAVGGSGAAPLHVRGWAAIATACVTLGWWVGVLTEAAAPRR